MNRKEGVEASRKIFLHSWNGCGGGLSFSHQKEKLQTQNVASSSLNFTASVSQKKMNHFQPFLLCFIFNLLNVRLTFFPSIQFSFFPRYYSD
jgi:hypothetical protein